MKRRNFLSKGLAALTGSVALPFLACERPTPKEGGIKPKLMHRTLGKTGVKLPIISMGSLEATSEALVRTALDSGIAYIATSHYYQRGKVQQFIGRIIKDYDRDKILLGAGVDPHPVDWRSGTFSKNTDIARFEKDFTKSLENLDVDHVDILFLSYVGKKESATFEPLMNAMEKIKRAGKTRFLGAASHSYVTEAIQAVADSGFYDVVMPAYNFMVDDIEERKEAVAYAAGKGLGVIAMKTISGVSWLSGERQVAVSNPKAALKWILQDENIHTTVPGFTTFEQLETNLSVMEDLTLTPEETEYLKAARLNRDKSFFCQGCGTCLEQCSSAPDIPTLMRCYMYAYGYRDLALAVRTLKSVKDDPIACADCTSCVVSCPMGFHIKERALDIIRIRDFPQEFFS